jgi:hypothetical protein
VCCAAIGVALPSRRAEPVDVDLTLIDEMLRMTPAERLRQNDRMAALATRLREAFEGAKAPWPNRGT